jgi:hypothetical protein
MQKIVLANWLKIMPVSELPMLMFPGLALKLFFLPILSVYLFLCQVGFKDYDQNQKIILYRL